MENNAWLLTDSNGDFFAVSDIEMVEYKSEVTVFPVPISPYYCQHVMLWRKQLIPIVNLALIFKSVDNNVIKQVGVFAYQTEINCPLKYLAILITESPLHIIVDDNQFCELPSDYSQDKAGLAHSCFSYDDNIVPILNLNYLCSSEFRNKIVYK